METFPFVPFNSLELGLILHPFLLHVYISHAFKCQLDIGSVDEEFLLGGKKGGKINYLVCWKPVSKVLNDGGLGIGA